MFEVSCLTDKQAVRRSRKRDAVLAGAATAGALALLTLMAVPAAHAQYSAQVLADNPLQYYRLGETSGTTAVDSAPASGVNNGTTSGLVTLGQPGAIVGDANTSYAFGGGSVQIDRLVGNDFSLEFWFNTTSNNFAGSAAGGQWYQAGGLVDMEVGGVTNDFGTSLAGGTVLFGVGNPDITIRSTSTNLNNGAWHHVVATRTQTSGLMQLYINGALQASVVNPNTSPLTASAVMRIGNLQTFAGAYTGRIDEVAVYGGVLSQARVTAHYNAGLGIASTNAPEPGSVALLASGTLLPLLGLVRRRLRSRPSHA